MSLAVSRWHFEQDDASIDRIERALLGSCIVAPYLLDEAALLSKRDFRSELRGTILETLRDFPKRRFDANLLAFELERRGVPPPPDAPGWFTAVARLLGDAVVDDETVSSYVRCIKEAAALRRAGLRAAR